MRKSIEQLQAEQIIASMIRKNHGDAKKTLEEARNILNERHYILAQKVTTTAFLASLYDYYEDFTVKSVKNTYVEYLKYYESYSKGNEDIVNQMLEIDKMLDGDLLSGRLFDIIKEQADEET